MIREDITDEIERLDPSDRGCVPEVLYNRSRRLSSV
jgi:hypothetical protein